MILKKITGPPGQPLQVVQQHWQVNTDLLGNASHFARGLPAPNLWAKVLATGALRCLSCLEPLRVLMVWKRLDVSRQHRRHFYRHTKSTCRTPTHTYTHTQKHTGAFIPVAWNATCLRDMGNAHGKIIHVLDDLARLRQRPGESFFIV